MMRPLRAFIMPRSTALLRRNTEPRFVSITASQSSGFMRSSKVSRVMPALLTRIVTAPSFASMSAIAASQAAPSATSSTIPRPAMPADFRDSPKSPRARSTRRRADDSRALAAERECDRVADAARSAGHEGDFAGERPCRHDAPLLCVAPSAASSDSGDSIACRSSSRPPGARRASPIRTLPGPHSTRCVAPACDHRGHDSRPAHRIEQLAIQAIPDRTPRPSRSRRRRTHPHRGSRIVKARSRCAFPRPRVSSGRCAMARKPAAALHASHRAPCRPRSRARPPRPRRR